MGSEAGEVEGHRARWGRRRRTGVEGGGGGGKVEDWS